MTDWHSDDWDDLQEDIFDHNVEIWGEHFYVEPRRHRPNKLSVVDHQRPEKTVCGIFRRPYRKDNFNPSPLSSRGLKYTDMAQREPTIEIHQTELPYNLTQPDRIKRLKNGADYEVTNVEPNGEGILRIHLVERGTSDYST